MDTMMKLRHILLAAMLTSGCDEDHDSDPIRDLDELSEKSDAEDAEIVFRDACSDATDAAVGCYFRESAAGNTAGANQCLEELGDVIDFCYPQK